VRRGHAEVDSTPGSEDPRRWCRDPEHGAAAVEFALVLSLLVALLGGIVDFGFAFNAQISLTHAAREGARVEAIGTGDPIQAATSAFSAPAVANFSAQVVGGCGGGGEQAVLETRADYNAFFLPLLSRSLQSQAVMRCGG
jgi:Flp pilus assembly protein TadG